MSRRQIAKLLGRSPQAVNNEVIRGQVKQMDTFRYYHSVYSSDYAHAYSSWELGTNENHNRMIRRFYLKAQEKL